jgi:hypothetical protein
MTKRLAPYGSAKQAHTISKVGKGKTPNTLAARMPSPELAAKVGPSDVMLGTQTRRVVRRNAQS